MTSCSVRSLLVPALSLLVAVGMGSGVRAEQKPSSMAASEMPAEFKNIGITENLGSQLDLSLMFKNEKGESVPLSSFYDGTHPVVISLVYYSCPGLCNFHLNGVIDALKTVDWSAGDKFQYLAISFDPKEGPELAVKKKESYMKVYARPGTEDGWHFLTSDADTIKKLTEQVGFRYAWNKEAEEWAHASAAVVTTPQGKISRYLHGITFDQRTFKLALSEATNGQIGSFVDKMVWYCFKYDPHQSKYTLYAFRIMQVGGALIILILAAFMTPVWIRARREHMALKK